MDLSIVTTMYCSQPYLEGFHARICAAAEAITPDFEIVFVNDGSPDASLEVAVSLFHRDPRVRVIDLSRNFGHHRAIMTGLAHARGDLIFLIDSDLEEQPELLGDFHRRLIASGADVVYGVQNHRKGGFWERCTGDLFYRAFKGISNTPVPKNVLTVRLMTKRYVSALVQHRDREIFLAGLWQITGFQQVPLPVAKLCKGSSSYDLGRKLTVLVNAVTSFSSRPLIGVFYLGSLILGLSTLSALYLVARKLFWGTFLFGWPSMIVSIWMIGGLTIFCIGIIGIYLSRVFMETKDRPYTIIREIYQRPENNMEERHVAQFRGSSSTIL